MELNHPKANVLSDIVIEHSQNTPDKIAINDGKRTFTYAELERISDNLAKDFVKKGVKMGDRICLIARKCSEIIPYAIAIWKAGAVYTPLDPELPAERLTKIIENITPIAIVGTENDLARFDEMDVKISMSFDFCHKVQTPQEVVQLPEVQEDDNAIIIHTSGTTGLPKGVVLQHKSLVAYFRSHRYVLNISNNSRCLNMASFHYDVSIQDTLQPLYFGAYIYLYNKFFIPQIALPLIQQERFTLITAVSTIFSLITGDLKNLDKYKFPDLEYLTTGAEVCSPTLINTWLLKNPGVIATNGYGPSEVNSVTVSHTIKEVDENRTTYYPIGDPHKGVEAVLVGENGEIITEQKVDGELYLGGLQLMKEYWRNEEATKKAFEYVNGIKYYKTGDICFYDENNHLVYNGRKDFEVKFNGRRINLTEITSMVQDDFKFLAVDCNHIRFGEADGCLNLVMRLETYPDDLEDLKQAIEKSLKEKLPQHSIPSRFCFYNKALRTSSGKVDRKWLFKQSSEAVKANKSESLFIYVDDHFVSHKMMAT